MANCGFRIFKDGTNFGIAINVTDSTTSSWSDFGSYNLYVNGSAAFCGNPRIFGVQYPGFLYYTRATNTQAVGEQFMVCATSGNYYSPRQHGFRTYTYNSSTGAANSSYHESYYLPVVDADRTNSSEFSILTSKKAVTIAQGGTGATTSANARTALGVKAVQTAVADPAWDGASLTFIDTISQNAQGVISPHKASIKLATESNNGIVSITTQTFAGEKHFLAGIYSYSNIRIREKINNTSAGVIGINNPSTASNDHRLQFYEYSYTTAGVRNNNYEMYSLPMAATNLSESTYYNILTTKTMAAYSSSTIAYVTNSHLASVSSFYVYRMGRFGILQAAGAALKAYGTSSWINVATIPEGYRPSVNVQQRMPGAGEWVCRITTTGAVDIYKSSTSATTAYFSFPFPLNY